MNKWINNILDVVKKKSNHYKGKLLEFPTQFMKWWINFFVSIVMSFKMMPKLFKYSYKSWETKAKNSPQTVVMFFTRFKTYKIIDYKRIVYNNAIWISLLVLIIYIIGVNPRFLQTVNFASIINQSGVKLLIALGAGTIIVARGTDLSAGRIVGVTAFVAAIFSQNAVGSFNPTLAGTHPILIMIVAMLVGAGFGLINGIIVSKFNVTPFVATLGSMLAIYGANQMLYTKYTKGAPVGDIADRYTDFSTKGINIGGGNYISWVAIIALAVAFLMWIVWTKLPWGRKLFAVGGNPQAAAVSGIAVPIVLMTTYFIGGGLYGLAGTLESWRTGSVTTGTGTMYELDAIAAAIVGGLSFDGGKGKISGIVVGVLLFQTITYGFTFIGTSSAFTLVIRGIIIVAAVAIDALKNKVRK